MDSPITTPRPLTALTGTGEGIEEDQGSARSLPRASPRGRTDAEPSASRGKSLEWKAERFGMLMYASGGAVGIGFPMAARGHWLVGGGVCLTALVLNLAARAVLDPRDLRGFWLVKKADAA